MTREEIDEALDLAMWGVREMESISYLVPLELGLSEEEKFSAEDIPILIEVLGQYFNFEVPENQPAEVIRLGENDGVLLYTDTDKSGNIFYFLAPEKYQP